MHFEFKWLQLFAEGGGDGAGEGGAGTDAGVTSEAAAPETRADRLAALGVPKDKLNRRAYKQTVSQTAAEPQEEEEAADTQAAAAKEAEKTETPPKPTFEELLKDDEYNQAMQQIVSKRVAKSKQAEENLNKLAPALELLAERHGLDTSDMANLDLEALSSAILNDSSLYEDKALEMGVSVEVAKQIEQAERITAQEEARKQQSIEEERIQEHLANLQQQAQEMQKQYPSFDLGKELENPAFVRLTAPDMPFTVEEAYFTIHRKEILQNVQEQSKKQIANAIQAGQRRPQEGGVSKSNNASTTSIDWHNASKEQREDMKRRIYAAAASGKKIKPGG